MYHFVPQRIVKTEDLWCRDILFNVQLAVRDFFTFDIRLIGSGDRRLVTQNEEEPFDLDYNIILQRDKKNLLDNPHEIKEIFSKAFRTALDNCVNGYTHTCDSTSVITVKLLNKNKDLYFSFDVAIVVEGDDGSFYRLTHDKKNNRYIWNRVKQSQNYFERFQTVKRRGEWSRFKQRYLELKNIHLKQDDQIKSFSVFLETLNEF